MKQLSTFTFILFVILLIYGCASSQGTKITDSTLPQKTSNSSREPQWFIDKSSSYPEAQYLAEIGEGDSLKNAKANAAAAIAQIFSTRIKVDNTIQTLYNQLTGKNNEILSITQEINVNQNVNQSADQYVINLRYGNPWTDKLGRIYIVGYLNRLETGNIYRQRIIESQERAAKSSTLSEAQTDPLRRYALTNAAYIHSQAAQTMLEQLKIINMALAQTARPSYNPIKLQQDRINAAAALKVFIEITGKNSESITAVLSDWVTSQGFTLATANNANLYLTVFVSIEPVKLNNNYENFGWELRLSMLNSQGSEAFSLYRQGRSSGISESAAQARTISDISSLLQKNTSLEFSNYLRTFTS